jgi:hypothetical protein
MEWMIGLLGIIVTIVLYLLQRRSPQRVEVVKSPESDAQPAERQTVESTPGPTETGTYVTLNGRDIITLPSEVPKAGKYEEWVAGMRMSNRDGQLVGVVANFGHPAERFDSREKLTLPQILPRYLDVRGFKSPLVDEDYAEFEFLPAQDGRRIWLRAVPEGVLAIEVWRSWNQVPWDWILAEAYSSLVCLQDDRMLGLFQSNGIVQATLTLGNLLGRGGTTTDARVTTRGRRQDLIPPGEEVLGEWPRNPSIQFECGNTMNTDPWGCAKTFVHRVLTKTGVMLFEERLEEVNRDIFLNLYFETPGVFRRPQAGEG